MEAITQIHARDDLTNKGQFNVFTILHSIASSTLIVSNSPKLITFWHSSILDMPTKGLK